MMLKNTVTKELLLSEYNKYKKLAIQNFKHNKYELSLRQFEYITNLATYYPFITDYVDDDIEDILNKIGLDIYKSTIQNKEFTNTESEKVVFYNGQIIDFGALTEQYLNALINNNKKILFIVSDIKFTIHGKNILNKIKKNSNIKLFILNEKTKISKIIQIIKAIENFNPHTAFLHFLPNDVVGMASFAGFKHIKKFFIVHNDHTFWLGKSIADYFIEFRNFGVSLSVERRKIASNKILKIPYYPILERTKFEGFPFDNTNKVVGVSGANLYKYYMDKNLTYFKIIKELLEENPNFIFCLCGWGNTKPIYRFIKKNKLKDRFYFLGKRKDFYELIGNCDILFESYPLKGGLTLLFATTQKKPVVGIASYNNPSTSIEDFLEIPNYKQPTTFNEFKIEASKLINDENYRKELGEKLSKNPFNREYFEESINNLLNDNIEILHPHTIYPLKLNDNNYLREKMETIGSSVSNILYFKWNYLSSELNFFEKIKILGNIILRGDLITFGKVLVKALIK